MLMPKGWFGVILGALICIATIIWWSSAQKTIQETDDIVLHGYYYQGEQQMTVEEYGEIGKYKGFHGGEVIITGINPLTVKYSFGTLDDIPYLSQEPFSGVGKVAQSVKGIMPILLLAIGLLMSFNGASTIGGNKKTEKQEN
jgi:hypothetical protein